MKSVDIIFFIYLINKDKHLRQCNEYIKNITSLKYYLPKNILDNKYNIFVDGTRVGWLV